MAGERFQSISSRYAVYRPRYPDSIVAAVAGCISIKPALSALPVIDIGCGTGTFTRQLASAVPPGVPVIGVEPSSAMREQAISSTEDARISYDDGTAEHLPVPDGSARAVVAATAAHWFDRPLFYADCARALAPEGLLAVVEYVRDETSPATRAVVEFLNRFGEPRAYARPDYKRELTSLPAFHRFQHVEETVNLDLTLDEYAGLALSSSHARKAIEDLGEAEAVARLREAGKAFMLADGKVPYGYVFQAFMVLRV